MNNEKEIETNLEIKFLCVISGGLSKDEIQELLPRMVRELGSVKGKGLEMLRKAFARMVQARPPPLSQSDLLIALHRIDHTAQGMKTKNLLEAIGLCLSNKEIFRSDNIKDAITILMKDTNLSLCLMRTVILSAQMYPELKKFGLNEVVPRLIQNKTWESAPRVWEGVAMFIKSFAANQYAEPSLRAVLGLPAVQLRAIIKVATNARAPLCKLLKTFSVEERQEVLSGRWTGLTLPTVGEETVSAKDEAEKMKLIKELESGAAAR